MPKTNNIHSIRQSVFPTKKIINNYAIALINRSLITADGNELLGILEFNSELNNIEVLESWVVMNIQNSEQYETSNADKLNHLHKLLLNDIESYYLENLN